MLPPPRMVIEPATHAHAPTLSVEHSMWHRVQEALSRGGIFVVFPAVYKFLISLFEFLNFLQHFNLFADFLDKFFKFSTKKKSN